MFCTLLYRGTVTHDRWIGSSNQWPLRKDDTQYREAFHIKERKKEKKKKKKKRKKEKRSEQPILTL
jgi:hypothetical protein